MVDITKEPTSSPARLSVAEPQLESKGATIQVTDTTIMQASSDFAPSNPTDGRSLYNWKSLWVETEARKAQRNEGIYLAILLAIGLIGIFTLTLATSAIQSPGVATSMALALMSGLLGGATFDMKWWYHTIARGLWHLDRRAWRLAVPWVAAVVAMFVHILFKSDLLGILNPAAMDKFYNTLAFGFLVGYFSDSAIAKLAEIAESLFGDRGSQSNRQKLNKSTNSSPSAS